MEYTIKVYHALCETQEFTINGIRADSSDFGEHYDHDQENAEDYCCGNMRFDPKPHTEEILKKYGITPEEYTEIADKLSEELSFGCCGWCS